MKTGQPCPICGGNDRFYFIAKPTHGGDTYWQCRSDTCAHKEYDRNGQPSGVAYRGSKITLAQAEAPQALPAEAPMPYADLADYAHRHGADVQIFVDAGWADCTLYEFEYDHDGKTGTSFTETPTKRHRNSKPYKAIRFETDAAPRYRLLNYSNPKTKYWHAAKTHAGSAKVWYRLSEALTLATGLPVVLCNGEASVVAAQACGIPAICVAGGNESSAIPEHLLAELGRRFSASVIVALDCDKAGVENAPKRVSQLVEAGYIAHAVNLGGSWGDDLADFCRLHPEDSVAALMACKPLSAPIGQESFVAEVSAALNEIDAGGATPKAKKKPKKAPTGDVASLVAALKDNGYIFQRNTEDGSKFLNGERLVADGRELVEGMMYDLGFKNHREFELAVTRMAKANEFAYIGDRLRSLVWDGVPRIAQLAGFLHTKDTDVVRYADGSSRRVAEAFLRRWLIGAVGRVVNHDQNLVLVFAGAQGRGKSGLSEWLGSVIPGAYVEGSFDPSNKDTAFRMMGNFIWELGELDGTTSKHEAASVKLMLTQKTIKDRRPYDKEDTVGYTTASFIGTVNNENLDGFLVDPTGNRRFMVVELTELDWGYTRLDVQQVWAEAVALYAAGERGMPSQEEAEWRDKANAERHTAKGPLYDLVSTMFEITGSDGDFISNNDIYHVLSYHGAKTLERRVQMDIATALKAVGAQKSEPRRIDGQLVRGWTGLRETQTSVTRRSGAHPVGVRSDSPPSNAEIVIVFSDGSKKYRLLIDKVGVGDFNTEAEAKAHRDKIAA